jgi:hypothetical protein
VRRTISTAATVLLAAATGLLAAASAAPAASAAAVVFHVQQEDGQCSVDPGDVPALPNGAMLVSAVVTIVETPGGGVNFTCSGELPPGVSVPHTVQGYLPCFASDTAFVWAHYVVTASGHLQYTCIFPAGSV